MKLQPEFRWYYQSVRGLFSAVHIGTGYYDVCAASGKYRYQDTDGDTPFFNAGVSVGFRHTLGRSGNWMMEYSIGGGYLSTEYDRFYNIDNGRLICQIGIAPVKPAEFVIFRITQKTAAGE